jgi:hypothetical protein
MGLFRHMLRAYAAGLGFAAFGSAAGCAMSNPFIDAPRERVGAREPVRVPAHGFAIPLASAVASTNAPQAAGVPLVPEIQPAAQIAPLPDVPRLPVDVADPLPPVGPPPVSAPAPLPLPPAQEPVWTPVGGKATHLPPVVSVEPALPATPVRPPAAPPRVIPER